MKNLKIINKQWVSFFLSILSFVIFYYFSTSIDFSNTIQIKFISLFYLILICFTFFIINFLEKDNYIVQNLNLLIFFIQYFYFIYKLFYLNNIYYQGSEFYILSSISFFLLIMYTIVHNFDKNKFIILQSIIFYAMTNSGILGLLIIFLFIKFRFNFNFSKSEKRIFQIIPLFIMLLRALYASSEYFNIFWLSLMRKPFSGLSRFYDMQLVLSFFECNNSGINGSNIFYGSYTECQQPYSPIYELFGLTFEIRTMTFTLYFLIVTLLTYAYFQLIKQYKEKEEFIILFLISPPVNFLFYQGNLDLLPLVFTLIIFKDFNKNRYLNILFIFILSILEIHPIGLIIGLTIYFLKNKKFKLFSFSFSWFIIFVSYLFFDFNKKIFSNDFLFNFTKSESFISDIFSSFGLRLDLSFIANFLNINIFILITLFLTLSLLVVWFTNIKIENLELRNSLLFPFIVWMGMAIVLDNPAYRLSIFFLLFVLIFNQSNLLNYLIVFSIFLNPTPAMDLFNSMEIYFLSSFDIFNENYFLSNSFFKIVDLLFVFLNRFSLYFLFILLLKEFLINLKNGNVKDVKYKK